MVPAAMIEPDPSDLGLRTERSLELMHRWGYAPTLDVLAARLLGGAVPEDLLRTHLADGSRVAVQGRFAALPGSEGLIPRSRERVHTHARSATNAQAIADEFARALARHVRVVDCVGLSGSLATGGFRSGDDIDFDLFVRDGAKYVTYLAALLLGAVFTLRYRRMHGFRKLICINVVWTDGQVHPFERNDAGLAFELLNCRPLLGGDYFRRVLEANPWLRAFFPQIEDRVAADMTVADPSPIGRCLERLGRHPRALAFVDRWSRRISFVLYTVAHRLQEGDRAAVARLEFLRRVKFPYEVFQDSA